MTKHGVVKVAFGVGKVKVYSGVEMGSFGGAMEIADEAKEAFGVEMGAVCVAIVAFCVLSGFLRLTDVFRAVPLQLLLSCQCVGVHLPSLKEFPAHLRKSVVIDQPEVQREIRSAFAAHDPVCCPQNSPQPYCTSGCSQSLFSFLSGADQS
jgi:hypothetical protein